MSDVADETSSIDIKGSRKWMRLLAIPILLSGFGIFLGYWMSWSPLDLIKGDNSPVTVTPEDVTFVDLPQMVLMISGETSKNLIVSIKIEAKQDQVDQVKYLEPRIVDSFNGFLNGIDVTAFEKRGILEVIRAELSTRLSYILGPDGFNDILITEFRIQ